MNWVIKKFEDLSTTELYKILQLRAEVFVVEQNCPYQDVDNKDFESYHVSGYQGEDLVAYSRIVKANISYDEISIGRVVVSPNNRGEKLGVAVMEVCLNFINDELGSQSIRISAQSHLEKFYADLGFVPTGKQYLEDGIPHIEMLKS